MLTNKLRIHMILGVAKPLNINISRDLPETPIWVSIHHLEPDAKSHIDDELKNNFDKLMRMYSVYTEDTFNTRTGYGQPRLNKDPQNSAGEKSTLINELSKWRDEIISGRVAATKVVAHILHDSSNHVGKDTVNDFIIFMLRDRIAKYNLNIYYEIQKNPSLAVGSTIGLAPSSNGNIFGIYQGLTFDGAGPFFLLPENILRKSVVGIKSIHKIEPQIELMFIIDCYELIRDTCKKLSVNERNATSLIRSIVKVRPSSVEQLMTKTENSQRNILIRDKKVNTKLNELLIQVQKLNK